MVGTTSGAVFEQNGDDITMTIFQGKTINFSLVWGGDTPIDVTGYSARMQLRKSATDTDTVAEFTVANSRVEIGDADGIITFSMTAADSAALEVCQGVYDIEIINGSGSVYQAQSGDFTIKASVTR